MIRSRRRWLGSLGMFIVLALGGGGRSLVAQEFEAGDLIDVVTVEIPTRVVDRDGRPVRGLTAKNFEVTEGKRKLDIVRVEVVDLAQTDEPGGRPWSGSGSVPSAARRRFLFLFDLSFSSMASIARAREGVLAMLDGDLHPSDLVGVARYSASRGVELVLGLTSDRAQIRQAVESLGVVDPALEVNDPLKLMLVDLDAAIRNDLGVDGTGRPVEPDRVVPDPVDRPEEIVLHIQDLIEEQSRTVRGEQTRPVLALASGLEGLAEHLASIPGDKQVVLLSEGFDDSFLTGTTDRERIDKLSQATAVSDAFQVNSDELYGGGAVRSRLLEMTAAFERAGCSVHTVDIGGLRAGSDARQAIQRTTAGAASGSTEAGLFLIASETGGRFVRNQNNLGQAMEDVLAQTSVTYVLVLQPPDMVLDGAFHPVGVEVRRAPKGSKALHRAGFYAPLPYHGREGEVRRLAAAELVSSGEDGGPVATGVLAAAFPTSQPAADVMVWVEMYGYGLLAGSPGDSLPVEVYAYAFRVDGSIADFATQAAVVDLRRHRRQIEAQGFKHVVRLSLEPGAYFLRVLVRNAMTGATGLKTQRLEVPDFGAGERRLSAPLFIEAEGIWVLGWGQDVSNNEAEDFDYPLTYGWQRLVPSADPLLPRGIEVPFLLLGFGFEEAPQGLAATLAPADGGAAQEAQIVLDDYERGAGSALLWARILATTPILPGRYALTVQATGAAGTSRRSEPIVVYVR